MKRIVCGVGILAFGWLLANVQAAEQDKDKLVLSKAEQEVLELTNVERAKHKLPALKPSPVLFKVARVHNANMAKQGKLDHDLDGKNPLDRVKESGYKFEWAGENIAFGDANVPPVVKGWMESQFHRENILEDKFTEIGLGVALGKDGKTYYTQVFGRPNK